MEAIFSLIPAALLGIPYYFVARKKGYNSAVTFLCFVPLLNFLVGMYYVGAPDLLLHAKVNSLLDEKEAIKCPYCAETIKAEAKICRYCNNELHA